MLVDVLYIYIEEINLNHNDASIKKILFVNVPVKGYILNGVYLGGFLDVKDSGYNTVVQRKLTIFIQNINTNSLGELSTFDIQGYIYDLMYI